MRQRIYQIAIATLVLAACQDSNAPMPEGESNELGDPSLSHASITPEFIYGVDDLGYLVRFRADRPDDLRQRVRITGTGGEKVVGIDFRPSAVAPANPGDIGKLYGITRTRIYEINPRNGEQPGVKPTSGASPIPLPPRPPLARPPLVRRELLPLHRVEQVPGLLLGQLLHRFPLSRAEPAARHRSHRGVGIALVAGDVHVAPAVVRLAAAARGAARGAVVTQAAEGDLQVPLRVRIARVEVERLLEGGDGVEQRLGVAGLVLRGADHGVAQVVQGALPRDRSLRAQCRAAELGRGGLVALQPVERGAGVVLKARGTVARECRGEGLVGFGVSAVGVQPLALPRGAACGDGQECRAGQAGHAERSEGSGG
ncbi:MAG: DUF4394 domain-containing protein [Gemmatimonadales bacterium]|nr:DUF4394 domain-containing protein [Gemmatimonadales bacterium]